MPYRAPVEDFAFLFDHVVGLDAVRQTDRFEDASEDVTRAILEEAGKMTNDVLAPLQRAGDLTPAKLENGVVRTSPGFADGFKAVAEGGWIGMSADPEFGGMGLPMTLTTAVNEMMSGACLSLQLAPLMSQGQIEALEHHASDAIKELYLPKLISGEWTGTMNLTEPQAGSDVGALATKAEDNGDGTYAISGQKVYITWGDNDFGGNICHLVLARLPGAPAGTKGISLFLVPKYLPNDDGSLGNANSLKVVSLEHKLGIHGSPTCVMQYDKATGWLVGPEQGGMAAMFTMMNNARINVGNQGVQIGERATQQATDYAAERIQSARAGSGDKQPVAILEHPDVRRMILRMKALTEGMRALLYYTAGQTDRGTAPRQERLLKRAFFLWCEFPHHEPRTEDPPSGNGRLICGRPPPGKDVVRFFADRMKADGIQPRKGEREGGTIAILVSRLRAIQDRRRGSIHIRTCRRVACK